MRNSELISWRDVLNIVFAAFMITLIVCGGAYFAAGGPMPSMADAAVTRPAKVIQAQHEQVRQKPAAVVSPVVVHQIVAVYRRYRVRPGDTLSTIAARFYGSSRYWTGIYWANKSTIHYANIIYVGQVLAIPATPSAPTAPRVLAPVQPPQPPVVRQTTVTATPMAPSGGQSQQSTASSFTGNSAFQSCVIARESGGNSQVMNSTGHYGLYQFSAGTWAAYGGNPADFGNASVSEQNQVFANAMATPGGASNWAPYDGC